jgi:nucleoid-associated protein YgaU
MNMRITNPEIPNGPDKFSRAVDKADAWLERNPRFMRKLIGVGLVAVGSYFAGNALIDANNGIECGESTEQATVQSGDTLWSISQNLNQQVYGGRLAEGHLVHEIQQINGKSDATISPGQVLDLPVDCNS